MIISSLGKLICFLAFTALLAQSCKKLTGNDPNKVNTSYEKLGIVKVQGISCFAQNGDPICEGENGEALRWSMTKKEWSYLGTMPTLTYSSDHFYVNCEDAQGNFYATSKQTHYVLTGGTGAWTKYTIFVGDSVYMGIIGNSRGDMAAQTIRDSPGYSYPHYRVWRKPATSTAWQLADDRIDWNTRLSFVALTDNGDLYLNHFIEPDGLLVMKAGTDSIVHVDDCGTHPLNATYCHFDYAFAVNSSGNIVYYQGTAYPQMYQLDGGVSYPAIPKPIFNLPDGIASFLAGFAYLPDGTMMGEGNNGGYESYHLFIRKKGASGWTKVNTLPSDNPFGNMNFAVNGNGEVFCKDAGLGNFYLYQMHY